MTKRTRDRALRLVLAAIVSVFALFALYAVVINAALSTSLFDRLVNGSPETIAIHYDRAWSLVPWRVHAKKLSVRGRDSRVEWLLRFDEVEFEPSYLALTRMRFTASAVRANGTSFRLRHRLDTTPATPDDWEGLPPIDGFPAYSVRPPPPPDVVPNEGGAHGEEPRVWTIDLEGVTGRDTREVWIDRVHFEGSAGLDGGFVFEPTRALKLARTHVLVGHGVVRMSGHTVADALDGSAFELSLDRRDLRHGSRGDLLHGLTLVGDAHAAIPDLASLPISRPSDLTFRGAAAASAKLRIFEGVLERGSSLEVTTRGASVLLGAHRITGDLMLTADVSLEPASARKRLAFRAIAPELHVWHESTAALMSAVSARATGESSILDLARPLEDLHVVLDVPHAHLPSARSLSRYIPKAAPIAIVDGAAEARIHLEFWAADKRSSGDATLHVDGMDMRLSKMRMRGRASVQGSFASYHFGTRRLEDASLTLDVVDGVLASDSAPAVPLVHTWSARLTARGKVVDLDDPLRDLDVAISLPAAEVSAPNLLREYLPKGLAMQLVSGHSRFSLNSNLELIDHLARGSIDIAAPNLWLAFRDSRLEATVRAHARVHHWRWQSGEALLDQATVDIASPTATKLGVSGPALSLAHIIVRARSRRFDFSDPLANVALSASFVDGRVRDAASLGIFLPPQTAVHLEASDGRFAADVRAVVVGHIGSGSVRVKASAIGVRIQRIHLAGDVALFADVTDWNFEKNTLRLVESALTIGNVEGRFQPQGGPQLSARRIALEASSPMFSLEKPSLTHADVHLVVDRAELPDARALAAFVPPDDPVQIESGTAMVGANLFVGTSDRSASGTVDVTLAHGAIRFDQALLAGNFHFRANLRGFDPDRALLRLSGVRLELRDVAVVGTTSATSDWRGDVAFSGASLRLEPVSFVGAALLDARDAKPLLGVLFGPKLPGIVVRLISMPDLVASAWVTASGSHVGLLDLDARGGNVGVYGSYVARGAHHRGAIVGRKSFLSVGFRLGEGGLRLRFFGLNRWLRNQNAAVKQLLRQ